MEHRLGCPAAPRCLQEYSAGLSEVPARVGAAGKCEPGVVIMLESVSQGLLCPEAGIPGEGESVRLWGLGGGVSNVVGLGTTERHQGT